MRILRGGTATGWHRRDVSRGGVVNVTPADLLLAAVLLLATGGVYLYWRRRPGAHASSPSPGVLRQGGTDEPASAPLQAVAFDGDSNSSHTASAGGSATALLDALPYAVFIHNGDVLYANPCARVLRGTRRDDPLTEPLAGMLHADDQELAAGYFAARLNGTEAPLRYPVRFEARAGKLVHVEFADVLTEFHGAPALLTCVFDLRAHEREIDGVRQRQEHYALALESLAEGVLTTDRDGAVQYANSAALTLLGVGAEQALGSTLPELVSLVDEADRKPLADPVAACLHEGRRVTLGRTALLLAADGQEHSIELGVTPMERDADGMVGAVALLHDVSELRGLTRQMSYQASHDALTGLLNRREFERRLEEGLRTLPDSGHRHVLCYLDLDRFKAVNDTCGHMAGDNMLRQIAALIRDKVRDSDSVARLGGDEFGLLLTGCPLDKARQIADDVCTAVEEFRFVWKDQIFNVSVSIGLVELGAESGTVEDALSAADSACYVAKQRGRSHVHVYSARDEANARHRGEIAWLQRLQHALREDTFRLFAQPIVGATPGDKTGPACEILLRLADARGADVTPAQFVEAARRYQLMPRIDRWVMKAALTAISAGAIRLPDGRRCAINLSGQTLGDPRFLEFVVECFDTSGVSPSVICFEVTESAVMANVAQAKRFIDVLHSLGCQFALDDFGSGIGSFANLRELAMDYIKIDGAFVRNLGEDLINQEMIAAMVKLARGLHIEVIAEQVESQAALDVLRRLGVDYVQGFLIGKPAPMTSTPVN